MIGGVISKTAKILLAVLCGAAIGVLLAVYFRPLKAAPVVDTTPTTPAPTAAQCEAPRAVVVPKKTIYGVGYVRGRSVTTLKNKYAGFVSKVHIYSQQRVKKGDVILEYDDYDLQTKIINARHDIAELEKEVQLKELALSLKRINPLPSEYRNMRWKLLAAEEKMLRHQHEKEAYDKLFEKKVISEFDHRLKVQEYEVARADFEENREDSQILKQGLEKFYIQTAETELANVRLKLKNRQEELAHLLEEQKYYRIVAPYDGLCITNSDTVHGHNTAGTSAAVVHKDDRKKIYAYFAEEDIVHIVEGKTYRFRSNQYDAEKEGFAIVKAFEVKKSMNSYGDKCYYQARFWVEKEVVPLRMESLGRVEIDVAQ